ncbi:hypothetical protein Pmar_PMAR020973, partial [Perkinsus marinus ATCC 50983]
NVDSGISRTFKGAGGGIADISEASALAAQFVIKHQQQQQEAAAAAAAAKKATSAAETNSASATGTTVGNDSKSRGSVVDNASPSTEAPSSTTVEPAELLDSELSSFVERGSRRKIQIMSDLCHQVIPSAKVPIVVLSWIGPNGNVQIVDVSINNQLPLHNTALLRNYVEMDKRVQILALCVK